LIDRRHLSVYWYAVPLVALTVVNIAVVLPLVKERIRSEIVGRMPPN
jgi:hypothetical protein